MRVLTPWIALAIFISSYQGSFGATPSDQQIQQAVQDLLAQRHPHVQSDWWLALGPRAPEVIISMYGQSTRTSDQMRLLQGLGAFDDPVATDFLKKQAKSTSDELVRDAAIRTLGQSQGAKEEEFIAGYLKSEDPQTRLAAAETLHRMSGDARADRDLRDYLAREKAPWIVARVKGEFPKPAQSLVVVSSSEDRLDPALAGTWSGFWVAPESVGAKVLPLKSLPARMEIELSPSSVTDLKGSITVEIATDKKRKFHLLKGTGKSNRFKGELNEEGASPAPTDLSAELSRQAGRLLLRAQSAAWGATLIVEKRATSAPAAGSPGAPSPSP